MNKLGFTLILTIAITVWSVEGKVKRDVEPFVEEGDLEVISTTTEAPKIPCDGKGKVCVEPKLCVKGQIDGNTLTRNYNYVRKVDCILANQNNYDNRRHLRQRIRWKINII